MAIVGSDPNMQQQDDPNQKDKDPNAAPTSPQDSGGGVNVSGSSASGAGASPSSNSGGASATPAGTSSGRFQNLQGYLKANAGYNQGQGLAGQMGSSLTGQEQQQEQGIGQAQQNWVNQNQSKNYDVNAATSNINNTLSNAGQASSDPNAISQFQQYLGANTNYVAPQSLDANGQLQTGVNNVQQNANLAGSENGRYQLLQNLYGTPGYSVGQQSLDNLLLQGSPGQLQNLTDTTKGLGAQLGNAYNSANQNVNNLISQYGQNAAATQNAAQTALGGAVNNFNTQAQQDASNVQAQRSDAYNKTLQGLQNNNLSADQLQSLGLSLGQSTFGIDPTKYLSQSNQAVTAQNAISAPEYAQIQALSKLAGTGSTDAGVNNILQQFAGNSQVGQLQDPYAFDTSGFKNAVQGQSTAYNKALNTLNTEQDSTQKTIRDLLNGAGPVGAYAGGQSALQQYDQGGGSPLTQINSQGSAVKALLDQLAQSQKAQTQGRSQLAKQYGLTNTLA